MHLASDPVDKLTPPSPLPIINVYGGPYKVVTPVSGLPDSLHGPACPHLVDAVSREPTQCGKLEEIGTSTCSTCGLVQISVCHASLEVYLCDKR